MGFQGFSPRAVVLLAELADNNDKPWFEAHKAEWEVEIAAPARAFVEAVGPGVLELDPGLRVEAKVGASIFRFHRDVRFSKDKRPYKTELGFRFLPLGEEEPASGFFMRVRPQGLGLAVGSWGFSPAQLARYRAAVGAEPTGAPLAAAVAGLEAAGCQASGELLKRVPAPWPQDHPRGALLRARGLLVGIDQPLPACLGSAELAAWCLEGWARLAPVHHWLRAHVGEGS